MVDTGHVKNHMLSYHRKETFIMAKKKRYSKEFRLQAAELVVRQGYTQAEASRRLGVSANSIAAWTLALRKSGDLDQDDGTKREADQCKELRKRVRQLEVENEILKKAAAYFAKESI
jgi:transposase